MSWVEGREQREAVGDPQLHRLRSRSEGGIGGGPHGFGDCLRAEWTSLHIGWNQRWGGESPPSTSWDGGPSSGASVVAGRLWGRRPCKAQHQQAAEVRACSEGKAGLDGVSGPRPAHGGCPADPSQSASRLSPAGGDVAGGEVGREQCSAWNRGGSREDRGLWTSLWLRDMLAGHGGPAGGRGPHLASLGLPSGPRLEPGDLTWMSHTASPPGPWQLPFPRDRKLHQPGVQLTSALAP